MQKRGYSFGDTRLLAITCAPVQPVSIVRASAALYFNIAFYGCFVVIVKAFPIWRSEIPAVLVQSPVLMDDPSSGFGGMAAVSPAFELQKGEVGHFAEGRLRTDC